MTQVIDADGQTGGLSWKGDEFINVDLYRRAANWGDWMDWFLRRVSAGAWHSVCAFSSSAQAY
jgi:hypothetical protein